MNLAVATPRAASASGSAAIFSTSPSPTEAAVDAVKERSCEYRDLGRHILHGSTRADKAIERNEGAFRAANAQLSRLILTRIVQ